MKVILWAIKHREPQNYEEGLNILHEMILNIKSVNNPQMTNMFFRDYYVMIFHDVFYVFSDSFHSTGLKIQAKILRLLFVVVLQGVVTIPLKKGSNSTNATHRNNKTFLRDNFAKILSQSFKNLTKQQIGTFIMRCFELSIDDEKFLKLLEDFLVESKIYTNRSNYAKMFETHLSITTGRGEDMRRDDGNNNNNQQMRALPEPSQRPQTRDLGELPTRQNDILSITDGRSNNNNNAILGPPMNNNSGPQDEEEEEMMMLGNIEDEDEMNGNNNNNNNRLGRERGYNDEDDILALPAPGEY